MLFGYPRAYFMQPGDSTMHSWVSFSKAANGPVTLTG
jgi:hypothetical protein